ncbi:fluoride efflux transporter CrcB [Sphingomonas sp. HHU CXW]|uniref:Fluoride-specific ion channel FluC n=1 Tax=Sphingomonas hominis TaxID=2741495 RepID=A0ABX2JG66_9SPHN|nr:fluoride efflux transporter CrcB [Sphingomonas hominis]NTS63611.1 fluoride efflux transporter CrcB [Sphingomonas hominis]
MNALFLVMAGGALGSAGRYLTGRSMLSLLGPDWPWGTMTVNLLGGLLMGLLTGVLARVAAPEGWRLFVAVGVLGGFTTFSSFSLDTVSMIERGALLPAFGYVAVSVIGSIAALFAGLSIVRVAA